MSEQIAGLSDQLESTFRQFAEFEESLNQRAMELEQREAQVAERETGLAEREQQLSSCNQDVEARKRELDAQVEALSAEREQLGKLQAELEAERSHLDQLQADLQAKLKAFEEEQRQSATHQDELSKRCDELAARETTLHRRESALAQCEQALSRMTDETGAASPPDVEVAATRTAEPEVVTDSAAAEVAAAPETPAEPAPDDAPAEPRYSGLFEGGGLLANRAREAKGHQQPSQQVVDADAGAGDSFDTVDLTDEEVEKMRVLRRLGVKLPDAELIARIRAERSASPESADQDKKRRKSKRGWFK